MADKVRCTSCDEYSDASEMAFDYEVGVICNDCVIIAVRDHNPLIKQNAVLKEEVGKLRKVLDAVSLEVNKSGKNHGELWAIVMNVKRRIKALTPDEQKARS